MEGKFWECRVRNKVGRGVTERKGTFGGGRNKDAGLAGERLIGRKFFLGGSRVKYTGLAGGRDGQEKSQMTVRMNRRVCIRLGRVSEAE